MTAELWHAGAAELRTHDLVATAGFWGSLGFDIDLVDPRLQLSLGGVELVYAVDPGVDPWSPDVRAVDLEVTNADLLHAELYEADVMPDGEADADELRARWDSTRDVSRLGALHDADDGGRAFTVFDPSNNALRCGHHI